MSRPSDKDPWCCASDKLRINIDGFEAGWLTAMKSVRSMLRSLPKEEALAVVEQLIADYKPFHERQEAP